MNVSKKHLISILSLLLALVLVIQNIAWNAFPQKHQQAALPLRTVYLSSNCVDYQSVLNGFEDAQLTQTGYHTTFTGYQSLDPSLFEEVNNLNGSEMQAIEDCRVFYSFAYDGETNIVSLSAAMSNELGELQIETIYGVAFINETGDMDAIMDIDGEAVYLSEMCDSSAIQNCGWFSKLAKKVIVSAVAVVAVAAVVSVCVATAGAGMVAVIAAGAAAGAVVGGVAGGIISYSEYGKLDWRWVAGGTVVGGVLGAATGWGVGSLMGVGSSVSSQVNSLIKCAKQGKLGVKKSLVNHGYLNKSSANYRAYYDYYNTIAQEIMKAKSPIVEKGTGYLKWVVEGTYAKAKNKITYGYWELVIDPVAKQIAHFVFCT